MNYEERDPYGMYKINPIGASGSGVRQGLTELDLEEDPAAGRVRKKGRT